MAKKEAPATLTGGAGFNYEDYVAARFLIDLLAGANTLGVAFGRVVRVDWQARDTGWLLDDLAVTCTVAKGERAAGCSCKRHRPVTEGGFPDNFVEAVWEQWLGINTKRAFREGRDAFVLVIGQLANGVSEAWLKTLGEALVTTPERLLERLAPPASTAEGSQSSQLQRDLFASLRCPARLRTHPGTDDEATVRLLRHVRLIHLDFHSEPSADEGTALAACQSLLRSGGIAAAADLWDRLLCIAADNRRHGGSVDLPGLVANLRGRFDLHDHPDFQADWATLGRRSREALDDVRCDIGGLPPLARDAELAAVAERLSRRRVCFLVGESGCGKSAIARRTAEQGYGRAVWLPAEALEVASLADLERGLGLRNPLADTLRAAPGSCLVVCDGVEGYSDRALRNAARLIKAVQADGAAAHVHVMLTAQVEGIRLVIDRLAEQGVPRALLDPLLIDRPGEREVASLAAGLPRLRWAALRPDLRPVLRNLKVLDWVAQAVRSGASVDGEGIAGLTGLIERIWERWVEGEGGFARSGLLQRVAAMEAETLSAGVPLPRLEHAERAALPGLVTADLLRVRNERVRFSHDLLGDWARLRALVGEEPAPAAALRARAPAPRWHRAVRLFGQRLLEQGGEDAGRWGHLLGRLDDGSEEGVITRDLFLEAVVLADNAAELLRRVWPVLVAQDGQLLQRLLDRFLYVATVPDPRVAVALADPAVAARLEHRYRIPFWPYWGAVLTVLHERNADVVHLAPGHAARVCALWLKSMPAESEPGRAFPWRLHAAQLAFAIACNVQARKAEEYVSDDLDNLAYEAALYAAPDLPDEVSALALQLARRRDEWPDVQARREEARQESEEARRRLREEEPERARKIAELCTPVLPLGPLRDPWPDGPRSRVDKAFQDACLDTPALIPLIVNRPDAALEVLLAVCIEEPQHEDPFEYSAREDAGAEHWQAGYPPLYSRGPFLHFLRAAPEHGLAFVLRLVNFATRRWAVAEPRRMARAGLPPTPEDVGINILIDEKARRWLGNERVLTWHIGWPIDSQVVICALMATERWLYEQQDAGEDIDRWLWRILAESESVAFAGLLCAVGKRQPALFEGVLRPLLAPWELYLWDHEAINQRAGMNPSLIPWGMRDGAEATAAREWHGLPHRTRPLADLAVEMLLLRPGMRECFAGLVATWRGSLSAEGEPERLLLLAERLNRDNYTETPGGFTFQWPEALRRRNEQDLSRVQQSMTLLTFPFQCQQLLEAGTPLPAETLPRLWETVQTMSRAAPIEATDAGPAPVCVEDAVCGGIAVLMTFHRDWLRANAERDAWCLRYLQEIVRRPPRRQFDIPDAIDDRSWDAFAAECGVLLLAEDRHDRLARELVAIGVAGFHYATTALTMRRGFALRGRLGDELLRMQSLAVRWAAIRQVRVRAENLHFDVEPSVKRHRRLFVDFIEGTLPVEVPGLAEMNAEALSTLHDLHARRFPGRPVADGGCKREEPTWYREGVRCRPSGLDLKVVECAFRWLNPKDAAVTAYESRWRERVCGFLGLSLARLPVIEDPADDKVEGFPDDYDQWTFGLACGGILRSDAADQRRSFWQPILDLDTPAHHWVESFLGTWFTSGFEVAQSPEVFCLAWSEMIEYAVAHAQWDPATARTYDLDDMVFNLLGFRWGAQTLGEDVRYRECLGRMAALFGRAGQRWLSMHRVAAGYASFLARPAADRLLTSGIRNLHDALRDSDAREWRERDLEERLIRALHACWERQREAVIADQEVRGAFLGLLTMLASRGSHAATALQEQVLRSS